MGSAEFQAAREVAVANLETDEGRAYNEAWSSELSVKIERRLKLCIIRHGPLRRDMIAVMRIRGDGKVEAAHVAPVTHFSECFLRGLVRAPFPEPPQPGYWVELEIQASP